MCYKELCRIVLGFDDIVHIQPEGKDSIFISRQNNPATIISLAELWGIVDKIKHPEVLNINERNINV